MLKHHRITRFAASRRHAGRVFAAGISVLALGLGGALHAAAPVEAAPVSTANKVTINLKLELNSKPVATPKLVGPLGQPMAVRWRADGASAAEQWELELNTTTRADGMLMISSTLKHGEPLRVLSSPRLLVADGKPARVVWRSEDGLTTFGIGIVATQGVAATAPVTR